MSRRQGRRRAGLLIPLFSAPTTHSWGIGDIGDLAPLTAWLGEAGQQVLQLLPLNEMAPGQQSPYSAISAMAIDPIFIRVQAVEDWDAIGGDNGLSAGERTCLEHVRRASRVEYARVRRLKATALASAFARFYEHEWHQDTERAHALRKFVAAQRWWLDDYALFRAIRDREQGRAWTEWPEPLRRHLPEALERVRPDFARDVLFHQYVQWLAETQWRAARETSRANGVALFGDLPFMVDADSADVWSHQGCLRLDVSVGAPPDAFSDTGQDWGMPLYDWDAMARDDFRWLQHRARRSADLYDGYRVDHLVGFYRTYGRPRSGEGAPFFTPEHEAEQVALGERVLTLFARPGAEIVAEDLGLVPDYVRASMAALGVPGFRILRWERAWHEEGQPFLDPTDYPSSSVAAAGTHDTEPLLAWWLAAPDDERQLLDALPIVRRLIQGTCLLSQPPSVVRDVLVEVLFASGSDLLLLPVQDVFGWHDRINVPGTVTPDNWTFRLPWPCDRLDEIPEARERQARLRAWADQYQRQ